MPSSRLARFRCALSTRDAALWVVSTIGTITVLGCNALTEVDAPDVRVPEEYNTASGASALAAGAITQFTLAFGGQPSFGNGGQVLQSGVIADELRHTSGNVAGRSWDARDPSDPPAGGGQVYNLLHTARLNLLTAIATLQRVAPDSSARIGQLFALTGYTEVFFAENFCSGVPLGRLDASFRPVNGQPLTGVEMYEQALADFDSALVYAADSARIVNLARIGRARALLNLGRFDEAAQAAASVPASYVYNVTFVTGALDNGLAVFPGWRTVPEREGGTGLDWRTANDPRVQLLNRGVFGAFLEEVWHFVPYLTADAPIRLASGLEARLIEAEAALQSGDASTWLSTHNTLRATVSGLDPLVDPGTPSARVDLHFRERAFWLFLTGHRHGDLRRLVRQYGRDAETVFPTGIWREGIPYGSATNLGPPAGQRENPNYMGCLNRDA